MQGTLPWSPERKYRILSRRKSEASWTRLDQNVRGDQVIECLQEIRNSGREKFQIIKEI